jgi:hypothetical protein
VDREAVLGSAGGLLTLPFGIAQGTKLRPVIHSGGFIGIEVPVWDIADNFGDTNLLVTTWRRRTTSRNASGRAAWR